MDRIIVRFMAVFTWGYLPLLWRAAGLGYRLTSSLQNRHPQNILRLKKEPPKRLKGALFAFWISIPHFETFYISGYTFRVNDGYSASRKNL